MWVRHYLEAGVERRVNSGRLSVHTSWGYPAYSIRAPEVIPSFLATFCDAILSGTMAAMISSTSRDLKPDRNKAAAASVAYPFP